MSFCNCTDITTDFILKSQLHIGKAIRHRELTGFQIGYKHIQVPKILRQHR